MVLLMKKHFYLGLVSAVAALAPLAATPAIAQTVILPTIPLSTQFCPSGAFFPGCVIDGTQTITPLVPATFLTPDPVTGLPGLFGRDQIDFTGKLQFGRLPLHPFSFSFPQPMPATVNLTTRIESEYHISNAGAPPSGLYFNTGTSFNVISKTVTAIDIKLDDIEGTASDGQFVRTSIHTVNPTVVVNDAVQVAGFYQSDLRESGGAVIFGKVTGTSTLVSGNIITTEFGDSSRRFLSPFGLETTVQLQETTKLDETGLKTPTIAVTDGINTNGSVISNLGAGVAPTDAVNKAQLDAEAAARVAADAALTTQIAAEATTRATADTALGNQVVSEATARAAADVTIGANVDSAVTTRVSAVAAADQRIANEASARSAADTALAGQLISESNARIAADTGLSARLDGISTGLANYDTRLDLLDRRIASGTAVAVALSGATFLPGQKHNVSFNVATYDGAHAASMQFAAMIAPTVAFNIGVASGLNKGGRTAARMGIIFSW
jgi:hypothetical protein